MAKTSNANEILVKRYFKTPEERCLLGREAAMLECTETIHELMQDMYVSRKELAKRSGLSRKFVNDFLDDKMEDISVRDFASLMFAVGFNFRLAPKALKDWERY